MHCKAYVICNASEPDNVLEHWYDDDGELMRVHACAQFRDGHVQAFMERAVTGWYVSVDGHGHWCSTMDEAWSHLPALLTQPDHTYEVTTGV